MAIISPGEFNRNMARRKVKGHIFHALCLTAVLIGLGMLGTLLYDLISDGIQRVNWSFLTSFPSRKPEQAGIQAALLGSIYVVALAGILAFTFGVGAAIYLEEYAARNWFASSAAPPGCRTPPPRARRRRAIGCRRSPPPRRRSPAGAGYACRACWRRRPRRPL